ncbi:SGNH/GDSL hydrolase family protein [Plebeiibacterium marinum]|uniref:SGNH/GDSL hydrolase family protein n=1 Tax=Plebeiibacterium marinum TaxID=2992111 RepID=A0AAE3MEV1_9BACT|nr:SGNH/GDSL hydrolase family protein [Plebeiobacterium marinum]MCW3805772.1 SGNH/GDSL hydrolase family protein [Plebeiobacterium marinum]
MQKIKYIGISLCTLLFTQCEVQYNDFKPSNGEADFTTFVALGDSYTAGYTDGALGKKGQENGFSYILAKQLEQVGSTGFIQPLVESEKSVGSTEIAPGVMNGYYELQGSGSSLTPVPTVGDMGIFTERVYDANGPVQNLGVPGAKVSHLLAPGYGTMNPYFWRFASDAASTSVVADAIAQNPTFVSLWIGGNDVLTYALAGGEADEITAPEAFGQYMQTVAASLFSNGTKGVIANVPDINDLPYISTIPYNALFIDKATADLLNAAYAQYNVASDMMGLPKIEFKSGFNALVIADEEYAHPGKIRQIKAGEKVLLPALSSIKNSEIGWGSKVAIPEDYVLDETEIAGIATATVAYNNTIKAIANSQDYNLAFVDLNALMNKVSNEVFVVDGIEYTSTFVTGGVFSLDGIHATGRGSAIIANEFIKAINEKYNCNIPEAAVNEYSAVEFPDVE